jgi:peptidyl-tRNA hydrolase, PTH1 family
VSAPLKLIVGLGNPGPEYTETRHNAGFWFLDAFAAIHQLSFVSEKKFFGETARLTAADLDCRLLKPMTFMNRSGQGLRAISEYYQIQVDEILVVHDEIDLDAGTIRLKKGGGHGGHNGLRDIIEKMGSADFLRMRIGVAHPGDRQEVVNHVLKRPSLDEKIILDAAIKRGLDIMPLVFAGELNKAMTILNSSHKPQVTSDK